MTSVQTRPHPTDPNLAGFDELIGSSIPGPVAAVYGNAQSEISRVRPIQAAWRPGRSLTMRYKVTARGGRLDGENDLVAVIGELPDGVSVVEGPDVEVGVWVLPDDPQLPGLRSALDLATVSRLLSDLGAPDRAYSTRLRAYRAGRRAVVQVDAGGSSLFIKAVPPPRIEALHNKHRFLADHLPVPDSLGLAADLGLVVMRAVPGVDLRTALRDGKPSALDAAAIASLVSSLPEPKPEWRSWSPEESLSGSVELLSLLLPEEQDRLRRLALEIGYENRDRDAPVHGDFHGAQILVDGPSVIGMIDVDTYGWGRCGDDAATMLAHLHLLASSCGHPESVVQLARSLNRLWDSATDPVRLRQKTAAHVLGLATGPFRVQSRNWALETRSRIDIAEQWVESARRIDEKSLTAASGSSHERHRP